MERHSEFWTLVAGEEIGWTDYRDSTENRIDLPRKDINDNTSIGLCGLCIGTLCSEGKLLSVKKIKNENLRETYKICDFNQNLKVLIQRQPASLKKICRKAIRMEFMKDRKTIWKSYVRKKLYKYPDLVRFVQFRS